MDRLAGSRCIVTGAGAGIGSAIAARFSEEGARVVLADVDEEAAEGVAADLPGEALVCATDVTSAQDVEGLVHRAVEEWGGLDVMVNNAGVGVAGTAPSTSEDDYDRVMEVCVRGTFLGMKYAIPAIKESGGGSIVNMSSVAALVGLPDRAVYSAAKGAIYALTRAAAIDHVGEGVRINCIAPGTVDTPWVARITSGYDDPKDAREKMEARQPHGRLVQPEEIAAMAAYLASSESGSVIGACMVVDGGHDRSMNPKPGRETGMVESGYDRVAERYLATKRADDPVTLAALEEMARDLDSGAAVLDLGCGAGVPATRWLSERFAVMGVDVSARQLELARQYAPAATLLKSDMLELDLAPQSFDAVVALHSVIHVPRTQHAALLGKIRAWLKLGGLLLATLSLTDFEGEDGDWEGWGAPMRWSHYDRETNERMLREAGFEILNSEARSGGGTGDQEESWLWILARRGPRFVTLRNATTTDLPAIVEIYNSAVPSRASTADTEPVPVEARAAWFDEHDPNRRPIRVAEDEGGRVAGWLSLSDFYDGRPAYHATAEVGVYVRADLRGRGTARRLLEEAIQRSPELGIKTLTAGIFAHNEASVGLFESFGFEEWARFPRVADLDGVERDLVVLGLRVERPDTEER